MADDIPCSDAINEVLLAKLNAAQERHAEDSTPENYQVYRQALKAFADWTFRGKWPGDSK